MLFALHQQFITSPVNTNSSQIADMNLINRQWILQIIGN
jgi:hypothetical protein